MCHPNGVTVCVRLEPAMPGQPLSYRSYMKKVRVSFMCTATSSFMLPQPLFPPSIVAGLSGFFPLFEVFHCFPLRLKLAPLIIPAYRPGCNASVHYSPQCLRHHGSNLMLRPTWHHIQHTAFRCPAPLQYQSLVHEYY